MKKYLIIMLTIIVASCADENLKPIVTFDDAGHGAYIRLLTEQGERSVDFFDIPNSQYSYSVDFVDEKAGTLVATYLIELTYVDVNGTDSQGPIEYKTYAASEFGTSENGFKSVDGVIIKATEMIAALGLTEADISQADKFIINGSIIMTSGAVHKGSNSSATIHGAAFQGHFDVTLAVVCPSSLAGTHDYSTVAWCGGAAETGTSEWVAEANGVYSITGGDYAFGAYVPCYGADPALPLGNLRINDLCNQLFWTGASQWGELYTFNSISVTGPVMVMDWENDYGEAGITTLTREGGVDWPPLVK